MRPVFTAAEMRALDARAMEELRIPGTTLMENAGRGAAAEIQALARRLRLPVRGLSVAVVCGRGNNGGDGFVVARVLARAGARVATVLIGEASGVRGDARAMLAALRKARLRCEEVTDETHLVRLETALARSRLVVDALLGTGASGAPRGLAAAAIERINACGRPVVALDLPSGVASDTGTCADPAVQATLTTTFAGLKRALVLSPAAARAGDVRVIDIGIPGDEVRRDARVFALDASDVRAVLPSRRRDAHKGDYGHLLVVAGSLGKTGAAALAARAAMRAGAGLVTVATPRSQQPVIAALVTEPMTEPLEETAVGSASARARDRIVELAKARDALALGPGLGLDPDTQALVRALVRDLPQPMVIDADALSALAGHLDALDGAAGPRCLTPHPGEMARLLGTSVAAVQAERIETVQRFCVAHRVHLVLKGAASVVGSPDGVALINPTGNPGMASGGTGDVLTGVVGALLARALSPSVALPAATYLHGLAGDLAARRRGEDGLVASDVLDALPDAILETQRGADPGGAAGGEPTTR
jgi:NAD(P)H-hydrate epimerase